MSSYEVEGHWDATRKFLIHLCICVSGLSGSWLTMIMVPVGQMSQRSSPSDANADMESSPLNQVEDNTPSTVRGVAVVIHYTRQPCVRRLPAASAA